jgi:hypothetical protein
MKGEQRPSKETPSRSKASGEADADGILTSAAEAPNGAASQSDISRGLFRLWPEDAFEYGDLVLFDRRSQQNRHVRTFVAAATALALGVFAYFSCALFRIGTVGRSARDAVAIPGVWLDLDTKGGAHKKQNLPTREEALSFVAKLPLQPTFILFSGGGLYCWWCFAELWVFDSEAERARAARLVAGWHALVRELAASFGWHVDNTSSLAQILRPEGGFNEKYSPAAQVQCIVDGGPRCNPTDFEEWIGGLDSPPRNGDPGATCEPGTVPVDTLHAALTHVDSSQVSYEQWRNVGFGLHHYTGGDDAGFLLWDEWSSRDTARYEGGAATRKLWSGFGRSDDTRRPVTIRSVVALARAGGWRGELPDPSLAAPLPAAEPTRPVVHDIGEAVEQVRQIAQEYAPGEKSFHLQSWAGCGKTMTVGRVAIDRIAAGAAGWGAGAVLALPERDLVLEKASLLRAYADSLAVPLPVRVLLGRTDDPEGGWYCERFEKASLNAELGRRACARCPLKGSFEFDSDHERRQWVDGPCATEPGRYLHARKAALEPGGLLVTTHAALAHAYSEIDLKRLLILDDAGPMLGIDRKVELRAADIDNALHRIQDWRERTDSPLLVEGAVLPHVFVADIAIAVLGALATRGRDRTLKVEAAARALPDGVRAALRDGRIEPLRDDRFRAQPWQWELDSRDDGPDGSPAFTDLCLGIASEVLLHGHAPIVERVDPKSVAAGGPELCIHLPDRDLIARARAGRVVWLSVAPIPAQVAEALGARREVLHANPRRLELVVGDLEVVRGDRGRTRRVVFGPGERVGGAPSAEDTLTRAIARAMAAASPNFGAVLLKADREALGNPDWCRSYGAGHAGSDDLADRELLLVRRFVPPYSALALDACMLRRALGIEGELPPRTSRQVKTLVEARRWRPHLGVIPTAVPADPLERELLRAAEAHGILNAIGRSRALSADGPRLVLVLDGRPFDTLGAALEVKPLADVLNQLGVLDRVQLPDRDARDAALTAIQTGRAACAANRRSRMQSLVDNNAGISVRTLARRLGCGERTVQRDLPLLRGADADDAQRDFAELRNQARLAARSANRSIESLLCNEWRHLAAPTVADAVEAATGERLSERAVRGHLATIRRALRDGAELVLPRRSDARWALTAVLQAALEILQQPRGAARRTDAAPPPPDPSAGSRSGWCDVEASRQEPEFDDFSTWVTGPRGCAS